MQTKEINYTQPSFQAYLKFKDKPHKIKKLRDLFRQNDKYLCVNYQKQEDKTILEVLSGKHIDKFLDLINKTNDYRELRTNIPKYLGENPKKPHIDKYIKKLDQKA